MNNLLGLGTNRTPFLYLDQFINPPDWDQLHLEVSLGIAKSQWVKKFVSSGVHDHWKSLEVTTFMRQAQQHLTPDQYLVFLSITDVEQKIKFMNCILGVSHPFWLIFIRNNRRIELSGIANKSVGVDSQWTSNSQYFPNIIKLINSMPFQEVGRVVIFMTESNNSTVPHYDAGDQHQRSSKPNDDFVWFTTTKSSKQIFVMNSQTQEKFYPDSKQKFIWWNEMDFHGTDSVDKFTFSIRIDGKFLPEVRSQLLGI